MKTLKEYLKRIKDSKNAVRNQRLNEDGSEILDPTPVRMPLGFNRAKTVKELVQEQMAYEMNRLKAQLDADEMESFEEAMDFDVGDDYIPDIDDAEYSLEKGLDNSGKEAENIINEVLDGKAKDVSDESSGTSSAGSSSNNSKSISEDGSRAT